MRLWVERAYEVWPAGDVTPADIVSTLSTEEQFIAAAVSYPAFVVRCLSSAPLTQQAMAGLLAGNSMDWVMAEMLAALPAGEHLAVALLRIASDGRASLAEIDAPPLFMARRGDFVLLPVAEEEAGGRLVRRCDFTVQAGDHLALVSDGFIRARGGAWPWSWRDVALAVRRLTATGCDAEQLAGALARLAGNSKPEAGSRKPEAGKGHGETWPASSIQYPASSIQHPASVLAMFVRPMRTAAVWTGPPADRKRDREALNRLLAEEGVRVICGDTSAEIAARLLGGQLAMHPPPPEGWGEVPPTLRLAGAAERVDLITEGAVTLRVAQQRLAETQRPRDLAGRQDGASRLAKLLLEADKITFLVGLAVNPAQTERDGTPLRKAAVEDLVQRLRTRGKIVSVTSF